MALITYISTKLKLSARQLGSVAQLVKTLHRNHKLPQVRFLPEYWLCSCIFRSLSLVTSIKWHYSKGISQNITHAEALLIMRELKLT